MTFTDNPQFRFTPNNVELSQEPSTDNGKAIGRIEHLPHATCNQKIISRDYMINRSLTSTINVSVLVLSFSRYVITYRAETCRDSYKVDVGVW
jgi:hypothetical protein